MTQQAEIDRYYYGEKVKSWYYGMQRVGGTQAAELMTGEFRWSA